MGLIGENDWMCFIDHDAMFTTPDWHNQLEEIVAAHPQAGLFTAVTSRVNPRWQCVRSDSGHDIEKHRALGEAIQQAKRLQTKDITLGSRWRGRLSGVVMLTSKKAWLASGGFQDGFYGVDCEYHTSVSNTKYKVYLMEGVYVYHWYRGKK